MSGESIATTIPDTPSVETAQDEEEKAALEAAPAENSGTVVEVNEPSTAATGTETVESKEATKGGQYSELVCSPEPGRPQADIVFARVNNAAASAVPNELVQRHRRPGGRTLGEVMQDVRRIRFGRESR
ncbi:MAG: hypothetical protein QUS33_09105 [Dehalococcoidia bacterium]|nr:hypothetical protein [Dehalococcoidia bacterium]